MKEKVEKSIQDVADKIAEEYQPEKIILFGSHAWGEPHEWSDVDLFIIKDSSKKRYEREFELRMKLLGNKFPPMDLLVYTPDEMRQRLSLGDFFIRDIVDRGEVLYERK